MVDKKNKGVVSADDWDSGTGSGSASEKEQAVLNVLYEAGRGGMNQAGLKEATGEKWLYAAIKKLFEAEKLEVKKISRSKFYRLTVATYNEMAAEKGEPAIE